MASDIFIKIGDIKGESQDDKHKDEVEVMSWSWGMTQLGTMGSGGGGGMGKVSFSDLTFMHYVDKASPNLMKMCATGEHLKEAKMTIRKSGKTPQEFLLITMSDVFITQVAPSGANGEGGMHETVSLQFSKVDLEYKPQKADGSLDAGIHFKYNIKASKEG